MHSVSCRESVFVSCLLFGLLYIQWSCRTSSRDVEGPSSVSCVLVGLSNQLELIKGRIEVMYAGIARGSHLKKNHCRAGPDWRGRGKRSKVELQNLRLPARRWLASRGSLHPEAALALVVADPNGKGSTESKASGDRAGNVTAGSTSGGLAYRCASGVPASHLPPLV